MSCLGLNSKCERFFGLTKLQRGYSLKYSALEDLRLENSGNKD